MAIPAIHPHAQSDLRQSAHAQGQPTKAAMAKKPVQAVAGFGRARSLGTALRGEEVWPCSRRLTATSYNQTC